MSDIIKLLPDSVANQIAAGEVVQRPSSVVKELIENSIDAGATDITVIIEDGGSTLIKVIDNGKGMSSVDCANSFTRHATSKIESAKDLFQLTTMGFRGEALASIAAVAKVKLKSRQQEATLGHLIEINGGVVDRDEATACSKGTSIEISSLFFNIPARRRFLKSGREEFKHIRNEIQRFALANREISITLYSGNAVVYSLKPENLKRRVISIFGKRLDERLISLNIDTSIVKINGYIGHPEHAKKRGSEQFMFVNGRYFKHPYFNKAIIEGYKGVCNIDASPQYFLMFEVDTNSIDVNIHPNKTEIKFEDEPSIWQIILAATRESLGRNGAVPSIDFNIDSTLDIPIIDSQDTTPEEPQLSIDVNYNPFETESGRSSHKREIKSSYNPFETESRDNFNSGDNFTNRVVDYNPFKTERELSLGEEITEDQIKDNIDEPATDPFDNFDSKFESELDSSIGIVTPDSSKKRSTEESVISNEIPISSMDWDSSEVISKATPNIELTRDKLDNNIEAEESIEVKSKIVATPKSINRQVEDSQFETYSSNINSGSKVVDSSNEEAEIYSTVVSKSTPTEPLYREMDRESSSSSSIENRSEPRPTSSIEVSKEPIQKSLNLDNIKNGTTYGDSFTISEGLIITSNESGLIIIDQHRAHKRVLFEEILTKIDNSSIATHQLLFPERLENLSLNDIETIEENIDQIKSLGFNLTKTEDNCFEIVGVPSIIEDKNPVEIIEEVIGVIKERGVDIKQGYIEDIAKKIANSSAINANTQLKKDELKQLITSLFNCENSKYTPSGEIIFRYISNRELLSKFR